MDNLRLGGPLGGKQRPLVEKVGECDVESRYLQSCSPPTVSVNDRWVPPSKY
jgi:hypothetical protein